MQGRTRGGTVVLALRERYRRQSARHGAYGWPYFHSRLLGRTFAVECIDEVRTAYGTIDFAQRSVEVDATRFTAMTERQFLVLAACMFAEGGEVPEERLLDVTGRRAAEHGAQLLRRNVLRLNAALRTRGMAVEVVPASMRYGSPYRITLVHGPSG